MDHHAVQSTSMLGVLCDVILAKLCWEKKAQSDDFSKTFDNMSNNDRLREHRMALSVIRCTLC
jgi:hypothetical protein